MSYVSIMQVPATGPIRFAREVRNNHQGAPIVWREMLERYHGLVGMEYMREDYWPTIEGMFIAPIVSWRDRVVLGTTRDGAMVLQSEIGMVIEAIEDWIADYRPPHCNLLKQVQVLDEIRHGSHRDDPKIIAFAWQQCSVSSDYWQMPPESRRPSSWDICFLREKAKKKILRTIRKAF